MTLGGLDKIDGELVRLLARRQVHVDRLARTGMVADSDTAAIRDQAITLGLDPALFDQVWGRLQQAYGVHARSTHLLDR